MNWQYRKSAWALILGIGLLPHMAHAQGEFAKKESLQRFREGSALMADGKYEQAIPKFVQAYATGKVPNVVYNLARCEHFAGHYLDATRHYREYLRVADPRKMDMAERTKIDEWIREISKHVARIEVSAPTGAPVFVDGERIGEAPLEAPVDVAEGNHVIAADANGKHLIAEVVAKAGVTTAVTLAEAPASAPLDVGPKTTTVGPLTSMTEPPREAEPPFWTTRRYVGAGLGVGAVAAAVTGGVFLSLASDKADEARAAQDLRSCSGASTIACRQAMDVATANADLKTGAVVAFAGAALLAGGAVYFFATRDTKKDPTTAIQVRGSFVQFTHNF